MHAPEAFTPRTSLHHETGRPLKEDLHSAEGRRGIIFRFLETEGRDPKTLEHGLDIGKLNDLLQEAFRGDVEYLPDGNVRDQFFTRFHPDVKYATMAAISAAEKSELTPELIELRDFMPFLRSYITERVRMRTGSEPELLPDDAIVIGYGKRTSEAPLLGGYHAGLSEQGSKLYDKTLQESVRLEGGDRPAYRVSDLLRAVAHDMTHTAQFKLYGRQTARYEQLRRKHDAIPKEDEQRRESVQHEMDLVTRFANDADIDIRQYGLSMVGRDHAIEIDGERGMFSLGAALFEFITDKIAREAVKEFQERVGKGLPEPENALEALEQRDMNGERITEADIDGLEGRDRMTGEHMVAYGTNIMTPALEVLERFGPLRARMEEAMEEAVMTGKFRKIKELRGEVETLPAEDVYALKSYAEHGAHFLRALFPGTEWK